MYEVLTKYFCQDCEKEIYTFYWGVKLCTECYLEEIDDEDI